VVAAGADWIHFDVMEQPLRSEPDNRPHGLRGAASAYGCAIDVHLMVRPVDRIVPDFAKAGANVISLSSGRFGSCRSHAFADPGDHGCKAGLVFNPATSLNHLDHVMDKVDLVLIMSVNPGFGGAVVHSGSA